MAASDVAVVATGTANIASVMAGLRRCGATPRLTESPEDVRDAEFVVLPGVGAFGAAMQQLTSLRLVETLRVRFSEGRPTLAICLGMQLLCSGSEESPGVDGLAVVDVGATRLPDSVRVPQLGWNSVEPVAECWLLKPGYAYFANSYCLPEPPAGWNVAYVDYGVKFVAAMERGAVLACQFHPELSGQWGQQLLDAWLGGVSVKGGAAC